MAAGTYDRHATERTADNHYFKADSEPEYLFIPDERDVERLRRDDLLVWIEAYSKWVHLPDAKDCLGLVCNARVILLTTNCTPLCPGMGEAINALEIGRDSVPPPPAHAIKDSLAFLWPAGKTKKGKSRDLSIKSSASSFLVWSLPRHRILLHSDILYRAPVGTISSPGSRIWDPREHGRLGGTSRAGNWASVRAWVSALNTRL